jgi:hypothetical protein
LTLRVVRDANAARLRNPFKTGGDIDTIAEDIVVIDNDVADVNADAKFDRSAFARTRTSAGGQSDGGVAARRLGRARDGAVGAPVQIHRGELNLDPRAVAVALEHNRWEAEVRDRIISFNSASFSARSQKLTSTCPLKALSEALLPNCPE